MSWRLLPGYKSMQIYVQGPFPVCPAWDLVQRFQIPPKKPKVGSPSLLCWSLMLSRAKENLKVSGEAPFILALLLCPWLLSAAAGVSQEFTAAYSGQAKSEPQMGLAKQPLTHVEASSGPLLIPMVLFRYQLRARAVTPAVLGRRAKRKTNLWAESRVFNVFLCVPWV